MIKEKQKQIQLNLNVISYSFPKEPNVGTDTQNLSLNKVTSERRNSLPIMLNAKRGTSIIFNVFGM